LIIYVPAEIVIVPLLEIILFPIVNISGEFPHNLPPAGVPFKII